MTEPHLFWTIFAAVLGAILLGGSFFWGMAKYSRLEKFDIQDEEGRTALIAILMPLGFLIVAFVAIGFFN